MNVPFYPDFWTTVNLYRDEFSGREINFRIGLGRNRWGQLLVAYNTGDGWVLPGGKESKARSKLLDFFERWTIYFDNESWVDSENGIAHFFRADYKLFIDLMWDWEKHREAGLEEEWYDAMTLPPEDMGDAECLADFMAGLLGYAHDVFANVEIDEEQYTQALDELEMSALGV
ncbi:MAG: hypothetical protein ABSB53_03670 [Nitrososphaerales archaeon]